ncbi:MAG: response regulator, partial [Rhodobacteraceae bacterium]|nr:response regulator [Paracoccaceae bacterium]
MIRPTVLLVEDEPAQRELLAYNLEAEGFDVIAADNGEDGLILVDENDPDLIVLDWMMPQLSGIEVCRRLKSNSKTRQIPVIMVVKPYSVIELMARVKAHLRRIRAAAVGDRLEYGDIMLDPETHKVFRSQSELKLGPTEFRLLSTFMEKPGRVWSRDQLLDRVWGRDIYVDTRTVDVHVGRLRKALCQ